VHDRGKAEKVKIEYRRKKDSYPVAPDDDEGSGFSGSSCLEYLSAADFSPDGKTLVGSVRFEWQSFGGKDSKAVKESHVIAWDASTGKEVWKSPALAKSFNTIVFSPDGKTITLVDKTGIGFWDAATGQESRRWQSKNPLFSARYSPDRSWLATGSKEEILLWEVATGKIVHRLAIPGDEIKAIAFSPDGKLLAGGGEKTIRFWDVLAGKSHCDCSTFANPVQAVAFSSDGKTLFSGHEQENVLRRWDVVDRKPSGEFTSPISPLRMLAFSPDSRKILASSTGEDFYLWEAETGKLCPLPKNDEDRLLTEFIASWGQSSLLRCEEGLGLKFAMLLIGKVERLDQMPGFLGCSVDGRRMLLQSKKDKLPRLIVLKVSKGLIKENEKRKEDIEREIVWKDGNEVTAALSPDGKTVAVAGKDVVCFFDVMTGEERRYEHPTNVEPEKLFRTQSVKFSPDGSRIALVGSEGKIRILAVKDGRRIAELAIKSHNASGLAFSPDGQTLLTTSFSAPVYAWEVATGQMVRKLEPATYFYSPDNRWLAGFTGTLKVFDLYSGRVARECKAESGIAGNFAFSPNSKLLAAGCADTTISIWPTSTADAVAGKPFDEKSLAEVLEKGEAADAYAAIGRMIADPERAIPFLEHRLHSAPKPDAKEAAISAEEVLHIRAIQALERIGTKRARQLLEKIAQGAETSPRTRAAVEALGRLDIH
jgi:WD40 repeat protein